MNATGHGHILIVEDEPRLAAILGKYLASAGYTHHWVADGLQALPACRTQQPDLVLLDLVLPGMGGMDICRALQRAGGHPPVIMVTALVEEIDRLLGLEVGADDYICKPFSPKEVVARIGAVLRRYRHVPHAGGRGPLMLDEAAYCAHLHDRPLDLTAVEFRLLSLLYHAQGHVFSRNQVLNHIYTDHRVVTDRTVDTHIKNLRRKLAEAGGNEEWIKSVYGVGYRMEL